MRRAKSLPPISGEPDDQDQEISHAATSPPPPYSASAVDNMEPVYFNSFGPKPQSPIAKHLAPVAGSSNQTHHELHSPSVVITPGNQEVTLYKCHYINITTLLTCLQVSHGRAVRKNLNQYNPYCGDYFPPSLHEKIINQKRTNKSLVYAMAQ